MTELERRASFRERRAPVHHLDGEIAFDDGSDPDDDDYDYKTRHRAKRACPAKRDGPWRPVAESSSRSILQSSARDRVLEER